MDQQKVFDALKTAIISTSVLVSLNTTTLSYIEADSLDFTTGVVLS